MAIYPEVEAVEAFVNDLNQAWKRLTLYPVGHPARQGVLENAASMVRGLCSGEALVVGVSKDALLLGDARIDSMGAQQLAEALHLRNVGIVSFKVGVSAEDLESLLLALKTQDEEQYGSSLGDQLRDAGVHGLTLEDVDYSSVVATSTLDEVEDEEDPERPKSLWDRILREKLRRRAGDGDLHGEVNLASVLEVIKEATAAGEGEIVARSLGDAITEHLDVDGARDDFLVRQVGELLGAIPAELRGAVLEAALEQLAREEADPQSLEALSVTSPTPDLLRSLRQLRDRQVRLSDRAVRLVRDLVLEDPSLVAPGQPRLSPDLMKQALATDLDFGAQDEVDDYVLRLPSDPGRQLVGPDRFEQMKPSLAPQRVVADLMGVQLAMLMAGGLSEDLNRGVLDRLGKVFEDLMEGDRAAAAAALVNHLRRLVGSLDAGPAAAVEERIERLAGERTAELLVDSLMRSPGSRAQIEMVVESLGDRLISTLLDLVADEQDRSRRRALIEFLEAFPTQVVPEATRRLKDPRWFVVRNMLGLLGAMRGRDALPGVVSVLEHADSRVRLEAARTIVRLDRRPSPDLVARLIGDQDPQVALRIVHTLGRERVATAVDPLLEVIAPLDPLGRQRELRLQAIASLGQIGDPRALDSLGRFLAGGVTVHALEERRAAYASLSGYPAETARPLLERGLRIRDAEIRRVSAELLAQSGATS